MKYPWRAFLAVFESNGQSSHMVTCFALLCNGSLLEPGQDQRGGENEIEREGAWYRLSPKTATEAAHPGTCVHFKR